MIARAAVNIIVSVHNLAIHLNVSPLVTDTLMARSKVVRVLRSSQQQNELLQLWRSVLRLPGHIKSFVELCLFCFITYFGKKIPLDKKKQKKTFCRVPVRITLSSPACPCKLHAKVMVRAEACRWTRIPI